MAGILGEGLMGGVYRHFLSLIYLPIRICGFRCEQIVEQIGEVLK